jgi:hypothetical protein
MEIATIGACGGVTVGQLPCSSKESIQCDTIKLGTQGRNAKKCIIWAMQAVAPSLQLFYLKYLNAPIPGNNIY